MAKFIKQLAMDAMRRTFQDVRDVVLLSATGVDSQSENQMRLGLRKKKIYLQMVKNSLARRVFDELGMKAEKCWEGPTVVAWGAGSLSELSREIETLAKKNKHIKPKGAISEGQEITYEQALKMPTRAEAIARVVMLATSPARRIAGQIIGPASRIASQVKTWSERKEEAAAPAEAAPAPAEAAPAPAETAPAPA